MTESFAEMFEESLANQELRRGAVVTGTVVDIQPDNVIVHAGLKSEGIIPIEQFKNAQGELEVVVGDEVEVSLEAVEDGFGETRLSREKAKRDQVWRRLEDAFEKEEIVKGVISGKVKGGFTVDIDDIRAFLRSSSSTSAATTWWCRAARLSKPNSAPSARHCWKACRKALSSRVS
jgi:small subunit ribosomal protein S1